MMGEGEVLPVWSFLLAFTTSAAGVLIMGVFFKPLDIVICFFKLANLAGGEGSILADHATSDPTGIHRVGES